MTAPVINLDPEKLNIDVEEATETGRRFAEKYQSGKPYHHICIDNFLPLEVAQKVREETLAMGEKRPEHMSPQEHLKTSYNPDTMPLFSRAVFGALNSQAFLRFLEEMNAKWK